LVKQYVLLQQLAIEKPKKCDKIQSYIYWPKLSDTEIIMISKIYPEIGQRPIITDILFFKLTQKLVG
jgi:hypothetical protein